MAMCDPLELMNLVIQDLGTPSTNPLLLKLIQYKMLFQSFGYTHEIVNLERRAITSSANVSSQLGLCDTQNRFAPCLVEEIEKRCKNFFWDLF